jgi:hypothetical protein
MPFVFVASAAASAAGWGLLLAPADEQEPVRRLGTAAAAAELCLSRLMEQRLGMVGDAYRTGKARRYRTASSVLLLAGAVGAVAAGSRSRVLARGAGAALLAGSACTRLAIFEAGRESARDPRSTVVPQRERADARTPASRVRGTDRSPS